MRKVPLSMSYMAWPGDVRRHQVRRELHAREPAFECARQREREQSLAHPRNALEQQMTTGQQADQNLVDHLPLTDDCFLDLRASARRQLDRFAQAWVARLRTRCRLGGRFWDCVVEFTHVVRSILRRVWI